MQDEDVILEPFLETANDIIVSIGEKYDSLRIEIREKLLARGSDQKKLAEDARQKRAESGDNSLVVRASLEFSNICKQKCAFCGMTALNKELDRYRMTEDQIYAVIRDVSSQGIQDLHLASGEDWGFKTNILSNVVSNAVENSMDVTLVTSQRKLDDYIVWKNAGALRYILKVETTNPNHFKEARTGTLLQRRVAHLLFLRKHGYKIGSGIICGLPNQTVDDLVNDILFFKKLKPDMASVSRFLPNYQSRYRNQPEGDHDLTLNFLSLLRIELSHEGLRIPAGTTLGRRQTDAINHGANVISLHVTPEDYAELYSADRIEDRTMTKMEKIIDLSRETGVPINFRNTQKEVK